MNTVYVHFPSKLTVLKMKGVLDYGTSFTMLNEFPDILTKVNGSEGPLVP